MRRNDLVALGICLLVAAGAIARVLLVRGPLSENLAVGAGALAMALLIPLLTRQPSRLRNAPTLRLTTWYAPGAASSQRITIVLGAGVALTIVVVFLGVHRHLLSTLVLAMALACAVATIAAIALFARLGKSGVLSIDAGELRFDQAAPDGEVVRIALAEPFTLEVFVEPRLMTWADVLLRVAQDEHEMWLRFTAEYAGMSAALRNRPRPTEMRGQFLGGAPAGFEVLRRLSVGPRAAGSTTTAS